MQPLKRAALVLVVLVGFAVAWPTAVPELMQFKRFWFAADARTIASNGSGTHATLTLTPTHSYTSITCNDTDGCDVTLGEPSSVDGMPAFLYVTTTSTGTVYLSNQTSALELDGPFIGSPGDSLGLRYKGDRWGEESRHSVNTPRILQKFIVLTDTQIRGAPTTLHFEIVPAAPTGYTNVFLGGQIIFDFAGGAYTNVSTVNGTAGGFVGFEMNDGTGYGSAYLFNDSINAVGDLSYFYQTFTMAAKQIAVFPPYIDEGTDSIGAGSPALPQLVADYRGNIILSIGNSLGDFTTTRPGNTLTAIVDYKVVKQ